MAFDQNVTYLGSFRFKWNEKFISKPFSKIATHKNLKSQTSICNRTTTNSFSKLSRFQKIRFPNILRATKVIQETLIPIFKCAQTDF